MSLSKLFPDAADNNDTLERLKYLSESFTQSTDDLFAKWEAYAMRQSSDIKVTDSSSLDAFQEYLEKGAQSVKTAKKPRLMQRQLRGGPVTPNFKHEIKLEPLSGSAAYSTSTLSRHNETVLLENEAKNSVPANFSLNVDTSAFAKERPFNAQLRDISSELDAQIERIIECVMPFYKLSKTDFVNPSQITQNLGYAVGRVVRDPPQLKTVEEAEEYYKQNHKLDSKSIILECSRRTTNGSRTSLDLSMLNDAQTDLFEGQIIAVKGSNPKGEQFIVHEILELPKLPPAQVASTKRGDGPVRIAVAAAPSSVQMLEAFTTWAYRISRQNVSTLILIGPLLAESEMRDENNNFVAQKKQTREHLSKLSRTIQTPIVLVPSPDDAFTNDPLFPQPAYPDSELTVDSPLIKVSNPCTFSIDEVVVGVAANSFIRDLDSKDTASSIQKLLRQRRFYPIYPAPLDVSVDAHAIHLANIEAVAPNLLIVPSKDGGTECGVVDDTLYIAAGKLANGFALVTVGGGEKPLLQRIGVDIMKLD